MTMQSKLGVLGVDAAKDWLGIRNTARVHAPFFHAGHEVLQ